MAFYKQTNELTKDYKKNSSFLSDRITDHANERVANITYQYQPPRRVVIDWFIGQYINQCVTVSIDSLPVFWKNHGTNIRPQ